MRCAKTAKWSDAVVAALLILMLGTLSLAQINRSRETANRVKCASNLRQIGQAILLYSNDNRGAYPRTVADINNPAPTWGTPYEGNEKRGPVDPKIVKELFHPDKSAVAPKPNDVTAALFLLLRTQDITSAVFICPSTGLTHWDYGGGKNTPMNWSNFPGKSVIAQHLSYSYQNAYPTKEAIGKGFKLNNSISAEFAIAADMNPGIDALLKLKWPAPAQEMRKGNSVNHEGDGQNVLYGDGHVEFTISPFVGVKRDNVYTYGNSGEEAKDKGGDGIVGPSVGPADSVLLPTAKDVGVIDAEGKLTEMALKHRVAAVAAKQREVEAARAVTPAQQEASRKKVLGKFVRDGAPAASMMIEEDKITLAGPTPASFGMKFAGIDKSRVMLDVFPADDPTTLKGRLMINFTPEGIDVSGLREVNGKWKKQQ